MSHAHQHQIQMNHDQGGREFQNPGPWPNYDLYVAIDANKPEAIEEISCHVDINEVRFLEVSGNMTPLIYAIHKNRLECVVALLNCRAVIDMGCYNHVQRRNYFIRPLYYALANNTSPEIIDVLLEHYYSEGLGYKLHTRDHIVPAMTLQGFAIFNNQPEVVKKIMNMNFPTRRYTDLLEDIYFLIKENYYVNVSTLVHLGSPDIWSYKLNLASSEEFVSRFATFDDGLAQCAIEYGETNILKMLIKQGYDIHKFHNAQFKYSCNRKVGKGFTLLHLAASGSTAIFNDSVVDVLLQNGVDVNEEDSEGQTPLNYAVANGNVNIVKTLIIHGVDIKKRNSNLQTALHIAIDASRYEVVNILDELYSPLHRAVVHRDWKMVRQLLSEGEEPNGYEEMYESICSNEMKIADILLWHVNMTLKNSRINGKPTLHCLSLSKFFDCTSDTKRVIKTFVNRGYDINVISEDNYKVSTSSDMISDYSLLHKSVYEGAIQMTEFLLEIGADVNSSCKQFHIPPIDSGGLDCASVQQMTPVRLAVEANYFETALFLLKNGGKLNGVDELDHCVRNGFTQFANILLQQFIPKNISLRKNEKSVGIPALQYYFIYHLPKQFNIDAEYLIKGYIRRGYNINTCCLNSLHRAETMPILHFLLNKTLGFSTFGGNWMNAFEFFLRFESCDVNVSYNGLTLLNKVIMGLGYEYSNFRFMKILILSLADATLCRFDNFIYYSGYSAFLRILFFAGSKFPQNFRDSPTVGIHKDDENETKVELLSFCDWMDEEKRKLPTLQSMARVAARQYRGIRYSIQIGVPERIKAYIMFKKEVEQLTFWMH